jgi:two-component system sensor kinase
MEASEKAGSVIKSLRFYLKEGAAQENVQIDLKENIMTVVNVFNHMIKEYNIDLQLSLEEDLVLNGFTNRLYQLWSNLLKNAIEATGEHGHISISSKRTDNGIEVSLSNTGEPIPQDIQDKIWKKFFTTKTTQGTGLGLSIVKRVAEEHGAKIQLHSGNEGTTFSITFEPN